ncbi:MAG: ABC transporter ATP-binding protein [Hyphomicrobiales bacterium]
MNEHALHLDDVSKRYGSVTAVSHLTLKVERGERVVLVGHNGAGKTTLFNMILGLTRPTGGALAVFGAPPGSLDARTKTAFLPENVAFNGALSGAETLKFFVRLRCEAVGQVSELLDRVGLADAAHRAVRTYSKGMRQRLGLAQALIGSPRLLVLDEPTSGLDPVSRKRFYDIVDNCAQEGTTVLTSSHALTEMEAHADRIVILRMGEMAAEGTLLSLRRKTRLPTRIRIQTVTREPIAKIADELGGRRINGQAVELVCPPEDVSAHIGRIAAYGDAVADVEIVPPGLNDIYLHFSTQDGGEGMQ